MLTGRSCAAGEVQGRFGSAASLQPARLSVLQTHAGRRRSGQSGGSHDVFLTPPANSTLTCMCVCDTDPDGIRSRRLIRPVSLTNLCVCVCVACGCNHGNRCPADRTVTAAEVTQTRWSFSKPSGRESS